MTRLVIIPLVGFWVTLHAAGTYAADGRTCDGALNDCLKSLRTFNTFEERTTEREKCRVTWKICTGSTGETNLPETGTDVDSSLACDQTFTDCVKNLRQFNTLEERTAERAKCRASRDICTGRASATSLPGTGVDATTNTCDQTFRECLGNLHEFNTLEQRTQERAKCKTAWKICSGRDSPAQ